MNYHFPMPEERRLVALDAFRGATIAGMLLVNNPGTWSAIYPPLAHATWHGWTPTDLIFPFFLFIVGITTHLSLSIRRERGASGGELLRNVLRRGGIIILLGLFLSSFPFYTWGSIAGNPDPSFLERVVHRFEYLRFMGVLQRIGLVYVAAALLTLRTSARTQLVTIGALLIGYWALMTLPPVPDSGLPGILVLDDPPRTMAAWFDRLILGEKHIWRSSKTWDPEGPLSTIPAIATAMIGILYGRLLRDEERSLDARLVAMFGSGALLMTAGLCWNWIFPINKSLWTSSYVLFTAGMGAVALATTIWIIDVRRKGNWLAPFVVFGVNPILAFVGSGLMARFTDSLIRVPRGDDRVTLHVALYDRFFASWLDPKNASLLYAVTFVAVWYLILLLLYRRKIFLKV
jgi:predicted acyltransferase